ncbi:hypothetical protein [Candidatus Thiosymbion oneisti]|uniref:hypothetical protein n=1 Tax=Candidatus Thiosymbion oneisti TaxID=589554 RepID=UPI000B7C6D82|nr:hypothetical protein [Candidatus Thiosymbion oneisti]
MSKTLCITNKLLSLKGKMSITDESENLIYDTEGEFAFFNPTWRINKGQKEVAFIRRKVFSWTPTWIVSSFIGDFIIKRKIWSWVRRYTIIDGPFNGATANGNMWDLRFEITRQGRRIAHAKGKLLTLRDKHVIEVIEDDEPSELITVIIMVTLHLDRKSESSDSSSSTNSYSE